MSIFRRLRHLFRRRQSEAEMAEEMRFHLEQRTADYAADGLPGEEARFAAQKKFGNVGSIQEHAREVHGWGWVERPLKDLQFALRLLAKSPGFTILAIATLGLGIGANTTIFTGFNAIMLKPLPYPDGARLESIYRSTAQNPEMGVSPADFLDLQREMPAYGEVAAYTRGDTSLADPGRPAEMVYALRVTTNLFPLLGVRPQLGREFRSAEDLPGNDRVVIISEGCWKNRFGSRADVIGRSVRIDGEPHEIVGVLPSSFDDRRHLGSFEIFRPLGLDRSKSADRQSPILQLIGRRSHQLSHDEAAAFIANFGVRLATDFPDVNAGSTWHLVPLHEAIQGKNGVSMMAMMIGLSSFVLLIACSNLANLLLVRAIARAREFAMRAALGASRLQLLRPLIAEALLLAFAGGVCAILVALWAADWLTARSTSDHGDHLVITLDWHVIGWAFGAALVTALAFGVAPALFAVRLNLTDTLKSGGRGATGDRGHQHLRQALIVGQFALAMILLAGAALFIRGLYELNHRRAGWESNHLVTATIVLPAATYPDAERITAFHRLALERLEALPGVASASISWFTPFLNWTDTRSYLIEGRALPAHGAEPGAVVNSVSPRYFETVGTRVLAGRAFDARDTATSPRVFIIGQTMASGLFGLEDPIGRRITEVGSGGFASGEIVGVVSDVKSAMPDPRHIPYQLYQPMAQQPRAHNEIAVRTEGVAASSVIEGIRRLVTQLDPDLPVRKLLTADTRIDRANYQLAVMRDMLTGMAVLGLGLASLGVYGALARTMAQRSSEFAVRLALGACVQDIICLVLRSGVKLALLGSALGLLGALGVLRLIEASFPGMRFDSLPVLIGTTLLLIAVALIACWLPARRAGKVDAMVALRAE